MRVVFTNEVTPASYTTMIPRNTMRLELRVFQTSNLMFRLASPPLLKPFTCSCGGYNKNKNKGAKKAHDRHKEQGGDFYVPFSDASYSLRLSQKLPRLQTPQKGLPTSPYPSAAF